MPTVAELAQQELDKRRVQQVSAFQSSYNPFNPNFRATVGSKLRELIDDSGVGGGYRQGLINAGEGIETAIDFTPIVGDAVGVGDIRTSYNQGDMVGTGINAAAAAIGALPIVGDVAAKGVKSTGSALRNIYHWTSPEAAKAIDELGFDLDMTADGSAWFTTNPDIGEVAAAGKGGVIQRQLDESNLKLASYDETDKYLKDQLIDMGYDGAYYPDGEGGAHYEIWNQDKLNKLSPLTGLDMNPEARMQRAQDLGFEEDIYYKGMYPYDYTKESGDYRGPEITEINRPEPFPAFNKGEEGVDIAGFLTKDPEVANRFAGSAGGCAVYPLRYRRGEVYTIDANGRNAGDLQFGESGQEFRDAVRSGNYDTIEIINTADEGDITISTKPENIRSINAEFDPAKADSSDLLSSVGATSALRGIV